MVAWFCLLFAAHAYHFDCEYINASTTGVITSKQKIDADLAWSTEHSAIWEHVGLASAQGEVDYGAPADLPYMNGFTYDPTDIFATFKPEFFKAFPPLAIQAENLVWDSEMFFKFASRAKDTKLGTPIKFESGDVDLAGSGKFHNKNVELTKIGSARVGSLDCDAIKYDAFFNTVHMDLPGGIHLEGRSHYWGEMYVGQKSSEFLSGTLYEDVLGELTLPTGKQTINVLRKGTFVRES